MLGLQCGTFSKHAEIVFKVFKLTDGRESAQKHQLQWHDTLGCSLPLYLRNPREPLTIQIVCKYHKLIADESRGVTSEHFFGGMSEVGPAKILSVTCFSNSS